MKNFSIVKMQELFNKSIAETFNSKYQNYDTVDMTKIHELLLIKGIRDFYFSVSLQFIKEYLTKIVKK